MKNDGVSIQVIQAGDQLTFFIRSRITCRGHNYTDAAAFFQIRLIMRQPALDRRFEQRQYIPFNHGHDHLGLGITEAGIEFQHFGSVGGNHQTYIQYPLVRTAFSNHSPKNRFHNSFLDFLMKFTGINGRVDIGPHTSGVRPLVVIKNLFMVLSGNKGYKILPIAYNKQADLLPIKTFLNNHPVSGFPQAVLQHDTFQSLISLLLTAGHYYPFACRQTVCFYHYRFTLIGVAPDPGTGFFHILIYIEPGGRYTVFFQQLFGENLAAFQARGGSRRSKYFQAPGLEFINYSGHKGNLRPHYGQIYACTTGKAEQLIYIISRDVYTFSQ